MRVVVAFASYNHRRYGKPWIAVVTSWPTGGKPEVRWGNFLGDARNGGAGEAEIEAEAGDVIRWGQKDNRGGNTQANWGVVGVDSSVYECDAKEARKAWDERQAVPTANTGNLQDALRTLWDAADSTINNVITADGDHMDNAQIRYIHHNVWLYVDDVDGFQLMTDSEAGSLGCDLEP